MRESMVISSSTTESTLAIRAALHGQLVAAVVDATKDAVAVYWASSDSLWPAPLVAETIAPGDQMPPMPFCVAIKLSRDADGGVSGATRACRLRPHGAAGFAGDPRQLNGLMLLPAAISTATATTTQFM
jgi:hypothetical protein